MHRFTNTITCNRVTKKCDDVRHSNNCKLVLSTTKVLLLLLSVIELILVLPFSTNKLLIIRMTTLFDL